MRVHDSSDVLARFGRGLMAVVTSAEAQPTSTINGGLSTLPAPPARPSGARCIIRSLSDALARMPFCYTLVSLAHPVGRRVCSPLARRSIFAWSALDSLFFYVLMPSAF